MAIQLPLHQTHLRLGAKMTPFAGFEMPVRYSSDLVEHEAVRTKAGLFDVSHMGEFWLSGENALEFLQSVTVNDVAKLEINQVQYTCLVNANGGVVDDLLIYRFAAQEFMLVVNASRIERDWEHLNLLNTFGVELKNMSDELCLFALQGPLSDEVLKKWTGNDFSGLNYYHFTKWKDKDSNEIIVSATGYTGERGFELYVPVKLAVYVWNALLDAGKEFGLQPIGLGARDTLRLEMGYCLYGHELNEETSPIESGLSWVVSSNKSFLASDVILNQKKNGAPKKLIAIEMLEKSIPRAGYSVCNENGEEIGVVTSGTMSPSLGIGVALAQVDAIMLPADSFVWVKVREKLFKGKMTKLPFVKDTSLKR